MKVIDPGHIYELNVLDEGSGHSGLLLRRPVLQFVKREGSKYPGNVTSYPGTTMQEVLRAVLDRLEYVNNQQPDSRNNAAAECIKRAIYYMEQRAAARHGREAPSISEAVFGETCPKCNHVGCKGECH